MTAPAKAREVAEIDRLANLRRTHLKALEDRKQIDAFIRDLEARIKAEMGDAEVARIDGVEVYTYAKGDGYAWAQWAKQNPNLAASCTTWVQQIDKAKAKAEHAATLAPFQTRTFLVK